LKRTTDLSSLPWVVSGWAPESWRLVKTMELGLSALSEVPPVPAPVPGSVQQALLDAGLLPDWNVGLAGRECEWVENRHWIYETTLPDGMLRPGGRHRLRCLGLDWKGIVFLNGREVGAFEGAFVPHVFDLTDAARQGENRLQIVFECPPRWLGQFGFTSRMTDWKPRFNYTWDWTARLVQVGIWDAVTLEETDGDEFAELRCWTDLEPGDGSGHLFVQGRVEGLAGAAVRCALEREGALVHEERFTPADFARGASMQGLGVSPWWPNLGGDQALYRLRVELLDAAGAVLDAAERRVGFKHVAWRPCDGAPENADPWVCAVNGRPVFLQGVNWTPIRPNFADVPPRAYRERLELYRDLGANTLRVWGGAFLEKECFYEICDELGLMVWQEFPLSSSGTENWPPEDARSLREVEQIARGYVARRQHHPSLLLWCGGNELQSDLDGRPTGGGKPVTASHPMIERLGRVVGELDPTRRFLATSSSGPRFTAEATDFGKGLHWDVHGPWNAPVDLEAWADYWRRDDALFRSEAGQAGASGEDLIRAYAGPLDPYPPAKSNPLWRRTSWWVEAREFEVQHGRPPRDLAEYVAWSQNRQARALAVAVEAARARFPGIGGILLWMGHDSFPCTANTSVVDFWGRPKPAALALKEVWRRPAPEGGPLGVLTLVARRAGSVPSGPAPGVPVMAGVVEGEEALRRLVLLDLGGSARSARGSGCQRRRRSRC
jgi:beta-mannosidase